MPTCLRSVKSRAIRSLALIALVCSPVLGLALAATPAHAATFTQLVINPGGGTQPDGSDGVRMTISVGAGGEDAHLVRGDPQWFGNQGGGPVLTVGTTAITEGEMVNYSGSTVPWDSFTVVSFDGSTTDASGTATGSGSATVRYVKDIGGLIYQVDRTVTYVFPNDYVTDMYAVTIPAGNTVPVKLYYGGDVMPGGNDQGYGIMLTAPERSVISLNTNSQVMLGFRETANSVPFAGAIASVNDWGTATNAATTGGDIGFNVQAATHDAVLMAQWDLGSTPGVHNAGMEVFVTPQGVTLTGGFRETTAAIEAGAMLDFSILNTNLAPANGAGFTISLPANLTIGSGATSNTCGGTLTATAGANTITFSGGAVAATANCAISIPVTAGAAGNYSLTAASVTSITGADNGVGTTTLTVTGAPEPKLLGLTPSRVIDTRLTGTPLATGESREITVAGSHGVPADATAVVVTATVTGPAGNGYLTLRQCGGAAPPTSTLNFVAGQTVANSATIGLGAGGKLCAQASAAAELILDVNAAYSATGGTGRLVALSPSRLDDTRSGAEIAASAVHEVLVAGRGGIPADATAVAVNLTVVGPETNGYATVFPCGETVPVASNVNFVADQNVAAGLTVKVGAAGKICITSSATTHLVVDVNAAYSAAGPNAFASLTPNRLADSRPQKTAAGTTYEVAALGQGGIPLTAQAVALNITIDGPEQDGYATVYPCGLAVPVASNVNFVAGQTVANSATVSIGTNGKVCVFTTAKTAIVVDVTAAFIA